MPSVIKRNNKVVKFIGRGILAKGVNIDSIVGITSDNVQGALEEAVALAPTAIWGDITGTLSDQTDLQNALDLKAATTYVDTGDAATLLAANAYTDVATTKIFKDQGNYDASGGAYPTAADTVPLVATIKTGFIWTISVAGTLPTGQVVEVGDTVRALIDTPGNTQANWAINQQNIGYTAENSANKEITVLDTSLVKYPCNNVVKTAVDAKQNSSADLTAIAALTPSNDDFLQRKAGVWTNRTPTQVKVDLGIKGVIGASFDGLGSAIVVGSKVYITCPFAGTIIGWSIVANGASPTCTIDVWKIATGTSLPTVANTIMGTKPALATGNAIKSTTLTGWTTSVAVGDIFCINIDALAVATLLDFQIEIQKT
jgi:hypothetical protein